MRITRLWLQDFRSYAQLELPLGEGLTAVLGPNGVGKTNVLEALGFLATLKSFRGAPTERVVRRGAGQAIVRAEGVRDNRDVLIELELAKGRTRALVNRQRLQRARDLLGAIRVTVFAPDDLAVVKDGPSVRREYLDDVLVALDPSVDAVQSDVERIIKQRNALLRQAGGRLDESAAATLDVWDMKLAAAGAHLTVRRENLLIELMPMINESYGELAGVSTDITAYYERSWTSDEMIDAISDARAIDVRRGVSTVGPHRDEIGLTIDGFDSRVEASQGEQRTLALSLRMAAHRLVTQHLDDPPLLLLDDVLSELDPHRAHALLTHLPAGQTVITSASGLPADTVPDQILRHDPAVGGFV